MPDFGLLNGEIDMSSNNQEPFQSLLDLHRKHLDRLRELDQSGMVFTYDDGRTLKDRMNEERRAIENLESALSRLG